MFWEDVIRHYKGKFTLFYYHNVPNKKHVFTNLGRMLQYSLVYIVCLACKFKSYCFIFLHLVRVLSWIWLSIVWSFAWCGKIMKNWTCLTNNVIMLLASFLMTLVIFHEFDFETSDLEFEDSKSSNWRHTTTCGKGVFFLLFLSRNLDDLLSSNFHRFFILLRYTKREDWSLTITNGVQCL